MAAPTARKRIWGEIKLLLPFGMVGACIGAYALLTLPTTPVLLTLGAFTMFFGFRKFSACGRSASYPRRGRSRRDWPAAARARCSAPAAPPYIMYLTRRLLDKGAVRATFSWLIAIDGGFRLGLFLLAGLLFDPKLQIAYALGLIPMAVGLYTGNKVHLDMTSEGMLRWWARCSCSAARCCS